MQVTEEMVSAAMKELREELFLPYSADIRDFTKEEVKAGLLRKADDAAEEQNRALVRRALEAALTEKMIERTTNVVLVSPCEETTEEEIINVRFEGRCFFYPGRDCKGWVYGGKCGRVRRSINREDDISGEPQES